MRMAHRTRSLTLCLSACVLSSTAACTFDDDANVSVAYSAIEANPDLTPGSLCTDQDRDFDGYRYEEQIAHCRRNVSSSLKKRVYVAYGIPAADRSGYEVDHRISLFAGGDNSFANLWPLPDEDARRKAGVEEQLYLQLRASEITQGEVIDALLNWQ